MRPFKTVNPVETFMDVSEGMTCPCRGDFEALYFYLVWPTTCAFEQSMWQNVRKIPFANLMSKTSAKSGT